MMKMLRQACDKRGVRILVDAKAERILTDKWPNFWCPRLVANRRHPCSGTLRNHRDGRLRR
jgi:hypothetical protein